MACSASSRRSSPSGRGTWCTARRSISPTCGDASFIAWAVAFVIPGIYFFAVYFAAPAINVIEDLGPWDSLVRSRALALRSLGGILLSLGLFWLLGAIIAIAIPRALYELRVPNGSIWYVVAAGVWAALFMPFRGDDIPDR